MKLILHSMFVRRLFFLSGIMALGIAGLSGRLVVLTLGKGEDLRDQAEQRLTREVWTPTVRGSILDRKGRVLAQDRPAYDLAIDYRVLSGEWASRQARRAAARLAGSRWADLGKQGQAELVSTLLPQYESHVDQAWTLLANTLGVPREELDARGAKIVAQVQQRHASISQSRLQQRLRDAKQRDEEVTQTKLRRFERDASEPIEDMVRPHVLARGVADAVGFAARRLAGESTQLVLSTGDTGARFALASDRSESVPLVPGLSVLDSNDREYPLESQTITLDTSLYPSIMRSGPISFDVEGVGQLLLGRLRAQLYGPRTDERGREVAGDAQRRARFLASTPQAASIAFLDGTTDRGMYREGDRIGDTGVEASQEHVLRGLRGVQRVRLESGTIDTTDATPGKSLQLTIDAVLQAKVQALLSPQAGLAVVQPWQASAASPMLDLGRELHGAAVVLDIGSGDVLAAASAPTLSRVRLETDPSVYKDEEARAFLNRALGAEYPPGSIVKPLMVVEAHKRGVLAPGERIACTGHYIATNPNMLRCLIWKTFGVTHSQKLLHDPDPVEAVGVSCNIFFYTMGDRLGAAGVRDVFSAFGVGQRFGMGAGFEAPGTLGSDGPNSITSHDAIQMGIGQGPVTWTPLHAANAYATLARGGQWLTPRVVITDDTRTPRDLGYSANAINEAMQGLWYAVNDPNGTGHHLGGQLEKEPIFSVPGIKVWGKTGTATAPDLRVDPDGDGPEEPRVVRSGDHSWFVVLAGRDRPSVAIAVVIEYGGSGGKVSGPITNQIINALVEEGLL